MASWLTLKVAPFLPTSTSLPPPFLAENTIYRKNVFSLEKSFSLEKVLSPRTILTQTRFDHILKA